MKFKKSTKLLQWLKKFHFVTAEHSEHLRNGFETKPVQELLQHLLDTHHLTQYQFSCIRDGKREFLLVRDEHGRERYLVREHFGRSGQAIVMEARDTLKPVPPLVALKRITWRNDDRFRFDREVEAYKRIGPGNPNIAYFLRVHLTGPSEGIIVTEFVEGGITLEARVQSLMRTGLTTIQAFDWLEQIANGLSGAHSASSIHRDLKPKNIMLERGTNILKLIDFGLAKRIPGPGETVDFGTVDGAPLGTYDWMPPEQYITPGAAEFKADVFSFGCVAFFILFGVPPGYPTLGLDVDERRQRQTELPQYLDRRSPLRKDLPPRLVALIRSCLDPDPGQRPDDAMIIAAELEAIRKSYSFVDVKSCNAACHDFRILLEKELADSYRDLVSSSDRLYVEGVLANLLTRINGKRDVLKTLHKSIQLAVDELVRNLNLWKRELTTTDPLVAVARCRSQFQGDLKRIRTEILEPLLVAQFSK